MDEEYKQRIETEKKFILDAYTVSKQLYGLKGVFPKIDNLALSIIRILEEHQLIINENPIRINEGVFQGYSFTTQGYFLLKELQSIVKELQEVMPYEYSTYILDAYKIYEKGSMVHKPSKKLSELLLLFIYTLNKQQGVDNQRLLYVDHDKGEMSINRGELNRLAQYDPDGLRRLCYTIQPIIIAIDQLSQGKKLSSLPEKRTADTDILPAGKKTRVVGPTSSQTNSSTIFKPEGSARTSPISRPRPSSLQEKYFKPKL